MKAVEEGGEMGKEYGNFESEEDKFLGVSEGTQGTHQVQAYLKLLILIKIIIFYWDHNRALRLIQFLNGIKV